MRVAFLATQNFLFACSICGNHYSMFIILHMIRHIIIRYFQIFYTQHSKQHYHIKDPHCILLHTAAHAFLQVSTGPAQQLHTHSCNAHQVLQMAGITTSVSVRVASVRLPFVPVSVICPMRTLGGTSQLLHRRCTPSETANLGLRSSS